MSLSTEARFWHDQYNKSDRVIQETVDDAYVLVANCFIGRGFDVNRVDTAEEFVAAIMKYLTESAKA